MAQRECLRKESRGRNYEKNELIQNDSGQRKICHDLREMEEVAK
jgi:hypothetical protein